MSVLIVDDHRAFRDSAQALLELDGFEVVATAPDGASGIELVRAIRPDVVLLDIALPDMSGFEVVEQVEPPTKVILTSSRQSSDFGRRVSTSGAAGFIPKDRLSGDAMRALLAAA